MGKLQTKVDVVAEVENGLIVCYLNEDNISKVNTRMEAIVNDQSCQVVSIDSQPGKYDLSDYAMHVGSFQAGEFLFRATLSGNVPDGTYRASIVIDGGKVVEEGTYDSLIERNGMFADLVARQRLDV